MKKALSLLLALCLALLVGCGAPAGSAAKTELIVFAAASLTETLTELGEKYTAANDGVSIIFNFDSSGTLKTQILEGADCDVFLSAAQTQMDALGDFAAADSRLDLLENKIALITADGKSAAPDSFAALAAALECGSVMLAMGNSDVPAGQYAQKILNHFGLDEAALAAAGAITYATNVKEICTQVAEAAVDCGIVYATDAHSAGLPVADTAGAEMCGQVIYPAAVMKNAPNADEAKAFLDYLTSDEADAVFAAVGFTPVA